MSTGAEAGIALQHLTRAVQRILELIVDVHGQDIGVVVKPQRHFRTGEGRFEIGARPLIGLGRGDYHAALLPHHAGAGNSAPANMRNEYLLITGKCRRGGFRVSQRWHRRQQTRGHECQYAHATPPALYRIISVRREHVNRHGICKCPAALARQAMKEWANSVMHY